MSIHKPQSIYCCLHNTPYYISFPPYFWVGKYREENVKKFRLFERSEFLNFSFQNDKFSVKLRNTAAAFFLFRFFFAVEKKMKRKMDGHIIRTLQIAKLFFFCHRFAALWWWWFVYTGATLRSPLPIICRPFRAKNHKRPCHFFCNW